MAFMTLKTVVYKKTIVNFTCFFFLIYLLLTLDYYRSRLTSLSSMEVAIVQNQLFLKVRFFAKKSKLINDFCLYLTFSLSTSDI